MFRINYENVETDDCIAINDDGSWYVGYAYVNHIKWHNDIYKTITLTFICDMHPFKKFEEIIVNRDDDIYYIENDSDLTALVI